MSMSKIRKASPRSVSVLASLGARTRSLRQKTDLRGALKAALPGDRLSRRLNDPVARGGRPALRFHVGKNRVAQLDGLQLLELLRRDLVRGFKAPPAVQQRAELLQVGVEAFFRVVARVL